MLPSFRLANAGSEEDLAAAGAESTVGGSIEEPGTSGHEKPFKLSDIKLIEYPGEIWRRDLWTMVTHAAILQLPAGRRIYAIWRSIESACPIDVFLRAFWATTLRVCRSQLPMATEAKPTNPRRKLLRRVSKWKSDSSIPTINLSQFDAFNMSTKLWRNVLILNTIV